jgi:hypothetical protein
MIKEETDRIEIVIDKEIIEDREKEETLTGKKRKRHLNKKILTFRNVVKFKE